MALAAHQYSVGLAITGPSAGAAFVQLLPSSKAVMVRHVSVTITAATATSIGIIRAETAGTGSTSTAGAAHNPSAPASNGAIVSAWSVAPTISGTPVYLRRIVLPATANTTVTWEFNDAALIATPTASLLLWNFGGGAASNASVTVAWDEAQ